MDTLSTLIQDSLAQTAAPNGAQNFLDIIGLAGGFQWPILLVFILGLGALMNTLVKLYQDGRESKVLRAMEIEALKTKDFRDAADAEGGSIYHLLLQGLVKRTKVDAGPAVMERTVSGIMQSAQESLALTHKLVAYCSSAAGGLGLAGTLVGIYSSFAAAGTDPNSVFVGISLALVSTLLGVAASLILEAADTAVNRFTTKYMAHGRGWGEEVGLRLSALQQTSQRIRTSKRTTTKRTTAKRAAKKS